MVQAEMSRRAVLLGGVGAAVLAGCRTGGGDASRPATTTVPTTTAPPPSIPRRRPSPNPYLTGNYAPIDTELTQRRLPVEGSIPSELRGTLLRNTPNAIDPDPATYHWFSGDGMIHAIELDDGGARYRNRWVRTDHAVTALGDRPIRGQIPDVSALQSRAQTSLVSHAGRVLALYEPSLPTEIDTDLQTIGRYDFDGALRSPMTAHPKIDPVSGEMVFFGLNLLGPPPYLRYHVVDRTGRLVLSRDIDIPGPSMMHDFAVTERHVVFLDLPVVYDFDLLASQPFPAEWTPRHGARVGVMPRDASSPPRWFDVELCYVFHTVNAYDDGESVVLDVVRHEQMFTDDPYGIGDGTGTLDRWTIDLEAGRVREERVDERTPGVPPHRPSGAGPPSPVRLHDGGPTRRLRRTVRHRSQARSELGHRHGRRPGTRQAGRRARVRPVHRERGGGRGLGAGCGVRRDRGPQRDRDPGRHRCRRRAGRDDRPPEPGALQLPRHLGASRAVDGLGA